LRGDVVDFVVKENRGTWTSGRGHQSLFFSFGLALDVLDVGAAQGQRPGVTVDTEAVLLDRLLLID
jgi:hypothetical protein